MANNESDVENVITQLSFNCSKIFRGTCSSAYCAVVKKDCDSMRAVATVKAMRGLLTLVVEHGPVDGLDKTGYYGVWLAEARDLLGLPVPYEEAVATEPSNDPLGR
jgi:hypothetical protein